MAKADVGYLCKHTQPHSHVGDGSWELEERLSKLSQAVGSQATKSAPASSCHCPHVGAAVTTFLSFLAKNQLSAEWIIKAQLLKAQSVRSQRRWPGLPQRQLREGWEAGGFALSVRTSSSSSRHSHSRLLGGPHPDVATGRAQAAASLLILFSIKTSLLSCLPCYDSALIKNNPIN